MGGTATHNKEGPPMRRNQPLPEGLYCPNWECSLFGQVEACKLERHAYYGPDRKVIFCLPHDALKRPLAVPVPTKGNGSPKKWAPRTPMMAESLTHHVWTLEELLSFRVPPRHLWTDP